MTGEHDQNTPAFVQESPQRPDLRGLRITRLIMLAALAVALTSILLWMQRAATANPSMVLASTVSLSYWAVVISMTKLASMFYGRWYRALVFFVLSLIPFVSVAAGLYLGAKVNGALKARGQ
jgi:hypothetical protein